MEARQQLQLGSASELELRRWARRRRIICVFLIYFLNFIYLIYFLYDIYLIHFIYDIVGRQRDFNNSHM